MPRELIFTSVPKGVKPGSTGYCTVAKHKGIDRLLDQAVEKLCFYELMKLAIKPVVHNYSIHSLNTGIFHVLTRTCYSGSDHTGRTNYISHNLIFDQAEALSQLVSPAEIFLRGTGWLSAWPEGQSPMFFQEGICNVAIPKPSGDSSYLPTWEQLTGKSNSAHELKGYASWKFITEGGEHNKTLSLLSEFSWLDPSYLEISWNQLTFTTYLQPSEKATNFRIVAGDPSVPAFNAISCATLNISSSGGANACFSSTGTGHFGPLPEIHQPIVEEHQNPAETVPIEPVYDETPFQTIPQKNIPVQPQSPTTSPTPKIRRRKSNLNLGKHGDSENLYDSADIPKGKSADGKSKLLILLISFFGFLVLGAAIFAGVYFWPEKAKRGNTHSPEIAKAKNLDEPDVNESKTSLGEKESNIDDKEKSKVPEEGLANTNKEKTSKSENSLDSLKDKFSKLFTDINSTIDSHAKDEGLESKFTQLYELKNKIEKNDPAPNNTIYNDKIKELEDKRNQKKLSQNPLPNEIPLEINGGSTVSEFSFVDSGKPVNPVNPEKTKTFYWDHKNKTSTEEGQNSMHIAYWTTDKTNEDGTTTQTFHLLKNISYKVDKNSFPKLKIDKDKFEVISSSSSKPDLKFPKVGRGPRDQRVSRNFVASNNSNFTNQFIFLDKLTVEYATKEGKLIFELKDGKGESVLNDDGQLILEENRRFFDDSKELFSVLIGSIPAQIKKVIENNRDKKAKYENSKNYFKENLKLKSDVIDPVISRNDSKYSEKFKELETEITAKIIDKLIREQKNLKDKKKFPYDFKKALEDKHFINNGTLKEWAIFQSTYKLFKTKELQEKIIDIRKEISKKTSDLKKEVRNKKIDNEKKQKKIAEIEDLKNKETEVNSEKKEFMTNFPEKPLVFDDLKSDVDKNLKVLRNYSEPLSQQDLEKLKDYHDNIQKFLKGPQYPWYVRNKTSNNIVLIIE